MLLCVVMYRLTKTFKSSTVVKTNTLNLAYFSSDSRIHHSLYNVIPSMPWQVLFILSPVLSRCFHHLLSSYKHTYHIWSSFSLSCCLRSFPTHLLKSLSHWLPCQVCHRESHACKPQTFSPGDSTAWLWAWPAWWGLGGYCSWYPPCCVYGPRIP